VLLLLLLVELVLLLLVVDVVADVPTIGSVIEFVHVPFDTIFINVAALGTAYDVYPAVNAAFEMLIAKGDVYPSASEYRSKGPVSVPAIVSVITTVCAICYGVVVVVDVVGIHPVQLLLSLQFVPQELTVILLPGIGG
jgi:hypothetical protein